MLFWLARLCKLVFVALAISNTGRVWRVAEPTFEVEVKDKTLVCHVDLPGHQLHTRAGAQGTAAQEAQNSAPDGASGVTS